MILHIIAVVHCVHDEELPGNIMQPFQTMTFFFFFNQKASPHRLTKGKKINQNAIFQNFFFLANSTTILPKLMLTLHCKYLY